MDSRQKAAECWGIQEQLELMLQTLSYASTRGFPSSAGPPCTLPHSQILGVHQAAPACPSPLLTSPFTCHCPHKDHSKYRLSAGKADLL